MRIGWRLERSKRIKSVTKGSGTNEESMNAANSNPIPPKAGKLAINQDLTRTQPITLPITWLSIPVREETDRQTGLLFLASPNPEPSAFSTVRKCGLVQTMRSLDVPCGSGRELFCFEMSGSLARCDGAAGAIEVCKSKYSVCPGSGSGPSSTSCAVAAKPISHSRRNATQRI